MRLKSLLVKKVVSMEMGEQEGHQSAALLKNAFVLFFHSLVTPILFCFSLCIGTALFGWTCLTKTSEEMCQMSGLNIMLLIICSTSRPFILLLTVA